MVDARRLIEYQEADAETDQAKKRLAEIQAQLAGSPELKAAQAQLQARERALREAQVRQKAAELEVETTRNRSTELERRMMSGQVNPRDLPSVQHELEHLAQRQKTLEDNVLGLMTEVEQARTAHEQQARTVQAAEAKWRETQAGLLAAQQRIQAALPGLEERRKASAAALDEPAKLLYQRMKARKGGKAMARVEGNMCSACRIALPNSLILRARSGKDLVYCGSCGRILYAA